MDTADPLVASRLSSRKNQVRWILLTFLLVLILDQTSKAIIIANIEPGLQPREGAFFYFTHQRNRGLVGGLFAGLPYVTLLAPLAATGVLFYLFRHLNPTSRVQSVAYGMVLGGALGNLIDRVRLGSVTDFIQVHFFFVPFNFPWKDYPAFNLADSGIVVGVILLVFTWNMAPGATGDAKEPTANPGN